MVYAQFGAIPKAGWQIDPYVWPVECAMWEGLSWAHFARICLARATDPTLEASLTRVYVGV
jgi:hypothetical protein